MSLQGKILFLTLCAQLDTQMHPGIEPEVGFIIEYEYSVTQFPPGDYFYAKGWYGGSVLLAEPRKSENSAKTLTGASRHRYRIFHSIGILGPTV